MVDLLGEDALQQARKEGVQAVQKAHKLPYGKALRDALDALRPDTAADKKLAKAVMSGVGQLNFVEMLTPGITLATVSYTHLTLPTICSV